MIVYDPLDRVALQPTPWRYRYLAAHFAKSQLWHASTLMFGFFLTEACGQSARAMGGIMAASLAMNGAIDAGLGRRWQKRIVTMAGALRLQSAGAPWTCLFFLLFCATPLIEPDRRMGWALVMLLGFRVCYPFLDVPQNAVVALAGLTDAGRRALLAQRNIVSGLAALAVGALAAPLLIRDRSPLMWLVWSICVALLVCGTSWWLRRPLPAAGDRSPPPLRSNAPPFSFALLLRALAVMMGAGAAFRTLEPYYAAYAGKGAGLLLWAAIGGLLSQPLWLAGGRRIGTSGLLNGAALLSVAVGGLLVSPMRATPSGAAVIGLGFGVASGSLWLMLWTVLMQHAATGTATGYVGTFTCVSKLAQAAAMVTLGEVLATSAYRETLADPWSMPSLTMVAAVAAIAATCVALAIACGINRTASGGRRAMPHPADRRVQGRG